MEIIIRYHGDLQDVMMQIGAPPPEVLTDEYAIAEVSETQIALLRTFTEIEYMEPPRSLLLEDLRSIQAACIRTVQNIEGLSGKGVLIAVLDSGIDYQNSYFKYEDGKSRIVSLWDQTDTTGEPPVGFRLGSAYSQEELTEGRSPQQDTLGHGTAVAALALEAAPDAELIVVKLGTSPGYAFTKTTQIMRALKYVIETARERNQPIVVNLSLGTNNGSHSGDSLFETYIDEWARRWRTSIVVAAGNEGIAGRHAAGVLRSFEKRIVEFQIQGTQQQLSLQVWRSFADEIQVGIVSPGGVSTGIQPIGPGVYRRDVQGNQVSIYYGEPNPYTISVPVYIELEGEALTNGVWKLELESREVTGGSYNIWISSEQNIRGEVYFLVPEEAVTVTVPSVTARTIGVAAYDVEKDAIADFSGRGYTRNDTRIKPDLAAPGVNIGLPKATGIGQVYSGTSMAAPIVSGACALLMEWGIVQGNDLDMSGERLKAFLLQGADRNIRGRRFPDRDWGYGKLCLEKALQEAVRFRMRGWNRQAECEDRITDEEYLDIVYQSESISEIAQFIPDIDTQCATELYLSNFLAHVLINNENEGEKRYRDLQLTNIPMVYGLCANTQAVDFIGSTRLAQPPIELTGSNVIVGIIDTGIEYRHPAFTDAFGKTKILSIWDQTVTGRPPEGYFYGTEYTSAQIEEALASENPLGIVPVNDENGHGTYIAGIAAGFADIEQNFSGAAPGADLIVVKLKPAKNSLKRFYRLKDSDLVYSHTDILQGTSYIIREAERRNRPVVLLYALSSSLGPHDGTMGIERYIQRLVYYEGIGIVSAAGNEANKGHHASGILQEENTETIEWNVDQGEEGLCLMVWSRSPDIIQVSLTTPRGYTTGILPYRYNAVYEVRPTLEESEIVVSYKVNEEGNGDNCVMIRLRNPTQGIWKMEMKGVLVINGNYDIWMTLSNWTQPETRFLRPNPYGTVTMPATGEGSIAVGGYDISVDGVYASSGRGPSRDQRVRPDLITPAVGVYGPVGPDGYQVQVGTSAAAAMAAGAGAQLMEWGIVRGNRVSMNTNQMRRIFIQGAQRRSGVSYPDNEWGYGVLNIYQSLEYQS